MGVEDEGRSSEGAGLMVRDELSSENEKNEEGQHSPTRCRRNSQVLEIQPGDAPDSPLGHNISILASDLAMGCEEIGLRSRTPGLGTVPVGFRFALCLLY